MTAHLASKVYCVRCKDSVGVVTPWHGWKILRRVWFGVLVVLAALSPILGADYCIMIPMSATIVAAGGPLHWLAAQKPTCRKCGLAFDQDVARGAVA